MRPLFLIQSHKNPEQLARLTRVIRQGCPDSIVLISHDFRASPLPHAAFGADPNVHVIKGTGGRGDFEIVDGYLTALRWLRDNRIDYGWVTNLSGQDYPVSSLGNLVDELSRAPHDGFLHHFDALAQDPRAMLPMQWPQGHGYDRYYFQYSKMKESLGIAARAALRFPRAALHQFSADFRIYTAFGLWVGRRARETPFTPEFRCYAGSYWHTVRRHCAEYLLDFVESKPHIVAYMKRVLIPDECFMQTVLVNNPGFRFVNDNRRYYDMRGSRYGHPKVMAEEDMPRFTGGRYFFARKFESSNGTELFDRLDQYALSSLPTKHVTPRAVPVAPAI